MPAPTSWLGSSNALSSLPIRADTKKKSIHHNTTGAKCTVRPITALLATAGQHHQVCRAALSNQRSPERW